MAEKKLTVRGKVVIIKIAEGSKSETSAVCIATQDATYVLRRVGANPFNDPVLRNLVGKDVAATGMLTQNIFLATDIRIVP